VFCDKVFTGHINYTMRVYTWDSILASETANLLARIVTSEFQS